MPDKIKFKFFLDLSMLITLIITAASGFISFFFKFLAHAETRTFLKLTKHSWILVHIVLGIVILILVMIHLAIQRKWIKISLKKILKKNSDIQD